MVFVPFCCEHRKSRYKLPKESSCTECHINTTNSRNLSLQFEHFIPEKKV